MKNLLLRCKALYDRHPFLSTSGLYFCIYGGGELSTQSIRHALGNDVTEQHLDVIHRPEEGEDTSMIRNKSYNWRTAACVGIVGAVYFAPFSLWWYRWLDRFLPGVDKRSVAKKIILNQLVAGLPSIPIFYGATSALQGHSVQESWVEVKDKFLPTCMTGMVYWPAVQSFNFMMVPTTMKPLYVGFCSYIWTNIICFYRTLTFSDNVLIQVVA